MEMILILVLVFLIALVFLIVWGVLVLSKRMCNIEESLYIQKNKIDDIDKPIKSIYEYTQDVVELLKETCLIINKSIANNKSIVASNNKTIDIVKRVIMSVDILNYNLKWSDIGASATNLTKNCKTTEDKIESINKSDKANTVYKHSKTNTKSKT